LAPYVELLDEQAAFGSAVVQLSAEQAADLSVFQAPSSSTSGTTTKGERSVPGYRAR